MNIENTRKTFEEPVCDVKAFTVEDIITTSGDDWSGGEF